MAIDTWTHDKASWSEHRILDRWARATESGLDELKSVFNAPDRAYPTHIYGIDRVNSGLAFGDLAVEAARRSIPDNAALTAYASTTVEGVWDKSTDLGMFTGKTGDLLAVRRLGFHDLVSDAISRNLDVLLTSRGNRVYDGRPGVLLGLIKLVDPLETDQSGGLRGPLTKAISDIVSDYMGAPEKFAPLGNNRPSRTNSPMLQDSGLLYGHLGIAWLMADAYLTYNDRRFLGCLNFALTNELSGYISDERYGTLQLAQGHRQLPYLSMGSAGFGVVLSKLGRDDVDDRVVAAVPQLLKATEATVCVCPGLFNGYSGLAVGRAGLQRFLGDEDYDPRDLSEVLAAFAMSTPQGAAVFAGDSGLRLTADVASGSAGILLAIESIRSGEADPFGFGLSSQNNTQRR
jgi:hypothetical protein